jgi:hypothetical protein
MEKSQEAELSAIYGVMDAEGRKQLVKMAGEFLDIQKILDNERSAVIEKNVDSKIRNNL